MYKFLRGAVVAAALLAAPVAFAATFSNVAFDNGDVTVSGQGGATVQATFHVVVPANQVVEFIQTDVVGDNLAPVDTEVGGALGLQEGTHDVTIPVKLPPNTGTYTLNVQGAGIFGGIRSISGTDNVVGTGSFGSALRVTANGSDPVLGGSGAPSWLAQIIAAITAAVKPPTPAPAPATNDFCVRLATKTAGATQGVTNYQNGILQGFLIGEGEAIPLLQSNQAKYGFWGEQTNSALVHFKGVHGCSN